VPTQSETELVTFQGWTLRVRPASADAAARLFLLLHGRTGDENSTWVFVRNFPGTFWMLAPRAPHVSVQGGYSWRKHPGSDDDRPGLEDLRPAADALIHLVDSYAAENRLEASQFDVMGFSQGAALTNTIALLYPERIRRAGVLAGFIPAGAEPLPGERSLTGKRIFVAHGTADETVPVEYARRSVKMLEGAGAQVTYCEDEVGHKVSAACLRALEDFFAR
jgi:phospholipase/carboxylesterase